MSKNKPESDPQVRGRILGATDGAAILGLSPWRSAVDVYLEKIGEGDRVDLSDNEAIQIGNALEDDVAELYTLRTGTPLEKYPGTAMLKGSDYIGCHPDYEAVESDHPIEPTYINVWLVECKTAGIASPMHKSKRLEWGLEGSDEVPQQYLVQAHHQMLCTGMQRCDIAALIGGRGLVIHRVNRDDTFLDWYLSQLVAFWANHVEKRVPPPPRSLEGVKVLYRKDTGREIDGSNEDGLLASIMGLRAAKQRIKELEAVAEDHELAIKQYMADAATLTIDGQVAATWRASEQSRIDTKALKARHPEIAAQVMNVSTVRRFLLKGEK